jgi:hypothetical protein
MGYPLSYPLPGPGTWRPELCRASRTLCRDLRPPTFSRDRACFDAVHTERVDYTTLLRCLSYTTLICRRATGPRSAPRRLEPRRQDGPGRELEPRFCKKHSGGGTRTHNQSVNGRLLCQLSYPGSSRATPDGVILSSTLVGMEVIPSSTSAWQLEHRSTHFCASTRSFSRAMATPWR